MASTMAEASETSGSSSRLPTVPEVRNIMPQFTAIMPIPIGTMISGSSVRLNPRQAKTKPNTMRTIRATAITGSTAKKVPMPGNSCIKNSMLRLPLSVVRLARAAGQLADTHDDGHHQQGNHRRQTVGHGCVWNNTHISFQLLTAAYSPGDGAAAPY